MFCSKDDRFGTIVTSVLIGGLIGAGIALLLAPQSGRKTREKIADLAEDLVDSAAELPGKIRAKLG
jgi:gas vesicle protein